MKQRTSFLKRCLAFALAFVLFVSQANLGLVQHVRAAENGANESGVNAGNVDSSDLFTIIAKNYGTPKIEAILSSGAVKGNETISYNKPSTAELESLVKLEDTTLTAESFASGYNGLSWAPYSYSVDGGAEQLFNGASVVVLPDFTKVSVNYRLTMTNYSADDVQAVLDMAAGLVDEAEGQKSILDRLASFKNDMTTLNKMVLIGANSVVDYVPGDFSSEVRADMKATISEIINNGFEEDGTLKLNTIIDTYTDPNNGGLTYYYQNAEYVKGEIKFLSEHLDAMLNEEEGHKDLLAALLNNMGFGQYVEKLDGLKEKIGEIDRDLLPVNANIDTTDDTKLATLVEALTAEGSVACEKAGNPYVELDPVVRNSDLYATIEVKVAVEGKSASFDVTVRKPNALTQAQVDELKAKVNAFVNETVEVAYYNNNFNNGAELDALVGVALTEGATYSYNWTAKDYIVKIEGEADQTVNVNNLYINLPGHVDAEIGMSYVYVIGDQKVEPGRFHFQKADLLNLFVDGVLTITRLEKNIYAENLVKMVQDVNVEMGFEALKLVGEDGAYSGVEANIVASDLMNLMMALIMKSGYTYIGLNNEPLVYATETNELELSLQTLVNAICLDEDFNNEMLVALGENGGGKLLNATMQLGSTSEKLQFRGLNLTVNLTSVPNQLVQYVNYIKLASKYITFHGDNGVMAFEVNMPDQAYAVYAGALVLSGNVDKNEVNELTQKVPVQFVYDYLCSITGSEMDLITYSNTLEMLGIDKDLAAYNEYYNVGMNAYNEYVDVEINDDKTSVSVDAPVKTVVDIMVKLLGIKNETLNMFLPMVKEYKYDSLVTINTTGKLENVDKTYYALVLDAEASGIRNKMEAPSSYASLAKETAELAGYSVIMLTADVPGDLTIAGTTILDLNGFDVEGTINATGNLYIIDSSISTYAAGTVGAVKGNAVIIAGNYLSDVSAYLKDGYYMDGTTVRHTLYTMKNIDGVMTFTLNGDFYEDENVSGYLPDVRALAVDIATDLVLNYYNTAMIGVEEFELVHMNFDDLVGLYAGDNRVVELAKKLLSAFTVGEEGFENQAGFEGVVNLILADLLNFEQITKGLNTNTAFVTHNLTVAPWTIQVDHNEEENYATLDFCANMALAKTGKFGLAIESKFNDNISAMTGVLADIVVADETYAMVDIPTPTYSNKTLTVSGAVKARMVMDMSHNRDYLTVIGVVLAYGNPDKAEAIAAALNTNNADDLKANMKAVIDNTSVKELFTALKKLSRKVDFATMAAEVGVNVTGISAEIERAFHLVMCAAGRGLQELDITGMNSKLGALYNPATGYYELTKENIFRDKEFNVRSYSALVELEATELTLMVKLFADDCLWGDANHDGLVNTDDASLIEEYVVNEGVMEQFFCTIRTDVSGDGIINSDDASLIREYVVGNIDAFPAENK